MIGKLPFLDLDSRRNSGPMVLVEPERTKFIPVSYNYCHGRNENRLEVGKGRSSEEVGKGAKQAARLKGKGTNRICFTQ